MEIDPEIKFLHYRYSDERGNVFARGGMTIAYREDTTTGVITHASARCHLNDNFRKDAGRAKAAGRLLSKTYAKTFDGGEASMLDAIEQDISYYNLATAQDTGLFLQRKYNGKRKFKTLAHVNADIAEVITAMANGALA